MIQFVNERDFTLQSINTSSPRVGKSADHIVLLVKAKWCPHCVSYMSKYEDYSIKFPRVKFLVLETTENERMMEQWSNLVSPAFEVNGYPTVALYDGHGKPVKVIADRFQLENDL